MKLLLDENLDWRLRRDLPGLVVESVPLIGWAGLKNGALLPKAEKESAVLAVLRYLRFLLFFPTEDNQGNEEVHRCRG